MTTDAPPTTLTDFILARIAEDEAVARTEWPSNDGPHLSDCLVFAPDHMVIGGKECDCGYPARVLAECEAKRRIVEEMEEFVWGDATGGPHGKIIRALAAIYADHPDFREAWRIRTAPAVS